MDIHGYSLDKWSITLLGSLLGMMIGAIIGGWMMDRIGRKTGLIIGSAGFGLFVALLGLTPIDIARVITVIIGFFLGFHIPGLSCISLKFFPQNGAEAVWDGRRQ